MKYNRMCRRVWTLTVVDRINHAAPAQLLLAQTWPRRQAHLNPKALSTLGHQKGGFFEPVARTILVRIPLRDTVLAFYTDYRFPNSSLPSPPRQPKFGVAVPERGSGQRGVLWRSCGRGSVPRGEQTGFLGSSVGVAGAIHVNRRYTGGNPSDLRERESLRRCQETSPFRSFVLPRTFVVLCRAKHCRILHERSDTVAYIVS
jgi:hypothetical protein